MYTKKQHNLRIVILVRMFPNIVQTYVLNHILSMKAAGNEILVVAEAKADQPEVHPAIDENNLLDDTVYISGDLCRMIRQLPLIPFANRNYLRAVLKIVFSGRWLCHGFRYAMKSIVRARVLAFGIPDIIHSHSLFSSYNYIFLREIFSIPFVTTFHGLVPNNVRMLERNKIRKVLQAGDAFFVNTSFARNQLQDYECPREKIHIIPQGTNLEEFPFRVRRVESGKPVVILSVGRLSIEKGFHIAIRAIARLKERFPDIEYRIIGGGLEEQNLRNLIKSLDLEDVVTLFGSVSTDELRDHYEKAGIFVMPSIDLRDGFHTETQGVVLQEAQASGIPVIASRTGGIPEVIQDQKTGLLFNEEDDEALARHIEALITDSELYNNIIMQARKDVEENFGIEVIRGKLISAYLQAINAGKTC